MAERDFERIRRAQAKVEKRRETLQGALEERRQAIQQALDSGETLATVGEVLGVTRQRVKQTIADAVLRAHRLPPRRSGAWGGC
jgi:DNA-directed RNA polymerase sigma subunit (sigma70/sigma32)